MNGLNNSSDDVAECPLCMEPLEVDDLNFYPCTCGYQVSLHLSLFDKKYIIIIITEYRDPYSTCIEDVFANFFVRCLQICRFCWHRIRTDENELCPACRKAYPENPADFTPLSQEQVTNVLVLNVYKTSYSCTNTIYGSFENLLQQIKSIIAAEVFQRYTKLISIPFLS